MLMEEIDDQRAEPGAAEHDWRRDTHAAAHRGLGLGLSLVKAVVEAHGGRVAVKSAEGAGSEFSVSLPVGATLAAVA